MLLPLPIQNLIEKISKLPGIGKRQATRIVFYLISRKEELREIIKSLSLIEKEIVICPDCFFPFQKSPNLKKCPICCHPKRNKNIICVVEKETDLLTIEETRKFNGLYHILGGLISPVDPQSYKNLRIKRLLERIKENKIKEIILAFPLTPQGEITSLYLERILKKYQVKITALAKGIPSGGEIEFADPQTIESAFKHRESL
ncbi:recombination protein RecR [bacterium]|nr:recombination protein RecR [bacterium]